MTCKIQRRTIKSWVEQSGIVTGKLPFPWAFKWKNAIHNQLLVYKSPRTGLQKNSSLTKRQKSSPHWRQASTVRQALCLFLFFPPLFNHIYGPSQWVGFVPDCILTHLPDKLDNKHSAQVHVQRSWTFLRSCLWMTGTKIFLCEDAYEQKKSIVILFQVL